MGVLTKQMLQESDAIPCIDPFSQFMYSFLNSD
jgi:hypothetical protein